MRILHDFRGALLVCLSVCLLLVVCSASADFVKTVEVVGVGECADCLEKKIKTNHALSGLHVSIDCKSKTGEFKTRGEGKLDEEGKFKVSLPSEIIEDGKLKEECYAQLHSPSGTPCPAHNNGLDSSKVVLKSVENEKHSLGLSGNLKFSSATCASEFLWPYFKHPLIPKPPKKKFPPLEKFGHPLPPFPKLPPKPFPPKPPVPVYEPKPKPPVPVYEPKPKPPVPVYEPKPKPPVPVYEPKPKPPVPEYEPKPKPPVPVYEPKPLPPLLPKKPCPPIKKPPLPPIYEPKPPVFKPHPVAPELFYKKKPLLFKPHPIPLVPIYKPKPPVFKPHPIYKPKPPIVLEPKLPLLPLPKPKPLPPFKKKPCPPIPKIPSFPKTGKFPPIPPRD